MNQLMIFKNHRYIIIILITYIYLTSLAYCIGVGVSPGNLTFKSHSGISSSQILYIKNEGTQEANYNVYVDDEYIKWFKIIPNNVTIKPNEFQNITITVNPPLTTKGNFELKAYVIATLPNSEFQVGSGIKIPIHLQVINYGLYIIAAIPIILISIILTKEFINKHRR